MNTYTLKNLGLSSLLVVISACSQTPAAPQAQALNPQASQPTQNLSSPVASVTAPAVLKPRTVISAGNTVTPSNPGTPASAIPSSSIPTAHVPTAVQLAQNYNTTTLLAGLRPGNGLSEAQAIASRHNLTIERHLESIGTVVFKTQGQAIPELLAQLKTEAALEYVEADQVATQKPEDEKDVSASFRVMADPLVNDTLYAQQYSLPAMRIPEAWGLSQGDGVVVAVIDTGVETSHPDLKGQLVDGYDAFSQKSGPEAGDVSSLNYLMSSYKHGTHVAGVIAANTNNSVGIAGVAPKAKVMPIKIFPDLSDMIKSIVAPPDNAGQTIVSILADGIVWATDNGADVINMSLSVSEDSATLTRAVQYALEHKVSVVVAAGNDRHVDNKRNYLAAIEGVVGVGATDSNGTITFFSNSGDYVDVAAPGLDIISTVPSFLNVKSYVKMSGTSMAAPNVAGVAALLKSKFGDKASPGWIRARLQTSAKDKGNAGRDDLYGHGLIDAYQALQGE